MKGWSRRTFVFLACVGLVACGSGTEAGLSPDVRRGLTRGREYASTLVLVGRSAADVESETAVALGYLERHRMGLGGPFRLMDYALNDPRLGDTTRVRLVWALLARTVDGAGYQLDPAALDRIGLAGMRNSAGLGGHHLEFIERTISEAIDPRGGELAVRLAYSLAAAESTVGRRGPLLAAQAAAQIRDRELAREDARRLLRAAEADGQDPLALLPAWRAERRFLVEQPFLRSLPLPIERNALELAPRLAASLRNMAPRVLAGLEPPVIAASPRGLLGPGAAARLAAAADSLDMPPLTPLVIAVDVHRRELLEQTGLSAEAGRARASFVARSQDEEHFVAEYSLLQHAAEADPTGPALTVLWAAVALRAYAQEEVWFPGMGGPSSRELEDRFGLRAVSFDAEVPARWRPYYRRMLLTSLHDLQRVLPSLDVRGLGFHFGEGRSRSATLALHDPRTRTVFLPPATSAGTIAHEVAHDLDWQVALRRYNVRGDYATDRATRQPNDRLATVLRDLASGELLAPRPGDPAPPAHGQRPAEVFARSVDWFVVTALAHEGRANGYLSSVQDDVLTGYGTVTPPDISGQAGAALVSILDEVAPLYPATRRVFLDSYGRGRALTPYDLTRRVLEASLSQEPVALSLVAGDRTVHAVRVDPVSSQPRIPTPSAAAALSLSKVQQARDGALAAIDAWICRAPAAAYDRPLEAARRSLIAQTATARARGIALAYAQEIAGDDGRRWLARVFFGPPWPATSVDPATRETLQDLADHVRAFEHVRAANPPARFQLVATPGHCVAGPLMAGLDWR